MQHRQRVGARAKGTTTRREMLGTENVPGAQDD